MLPSIASLAYYKNTGVSLKRSSGRERTTRLKFADYKGFKEEQHIQPSATTSVLPKVIIPSRPPLFSKSERQSRGVSNCLHVATDNYFLR